MSGNDFDDDVDLCEMCGQELCHDGMCFDCDDDDDDVLFGTCERCGCDCDIESDLCDQCEWYVEQAAKHEE